METSARNKKIQIHYRETLLAFDVEVPGARQSSCPTEKKPKKEKKNEAVFLTVFKNIHVLISKSRAVRREIKRERAVCRFCVSAVSVLKGGGGGLRDPVDEGRGVRLVLLQSSLSDWTVVGRRSSPPAAGRVLHAALVPVHSDL